MQSIVKAVTRFRMTLTCNLLPPLPIPAPASYVWCWVLTWQALKMELPLTSPARCELRSVIHFLCAKNPALVDIHSQLCKVYREKCMSVQHVRKWCCVLDGHRFRTKKLQKWKKQYWKIEGWRFGSSARWFLMSAKIALAKFWQTI